MMGSSTASEYAGALGGGLPDIDVEREVAAIELVLRAAEEGILRSAHDVSGGGLAVALAESALAGGLGAEAARWRPAGATTRCCSARAAGGCW